MTVRDYSTTANDNTTIEGIALADTMLANALDNAIRQAMADSANLLLDIAKPTATTGSANAYILTTGGTVDAYVDKVRLAIRPNFSNTGACTINVDTVGVVDLKIYTSSGVGNPASGQIQSGGIYDILYVDALGDFVVLNPTEISSIANVVEDTTPQLGGTLDTNSKAVFWSKGADVASATELLVLTDGNSFDVTGTTTIVTIEDTADAFGIGAVIILQFDGVLTLTHHATNLVLPSAANIITAAGDVGVFQKYASGDWRCTSYEKADGTSLTGSVIQIVTSADGAVATGTTLIPSDDTIPQNTEGDEYLSVTITPKSTTNVLVINMELRTQHSSATTGAMTAALFKNSEADALAVASLNNVDAGSLHIAFSYRLTAGTTSAITFKVRAGSNTAGTTTFNGGGGTRRFGGKLASQITVTEYFAS